MNITLYAFSNIDGSITSLSTREINLILRSMPLPWSREAGSAAFRSATLKIGHEQHLVIQTMMSGMTMYLWRLLRQRVAMWGSAANPLYFGIRAGHNADLAESDGINAWVELADVTSRTDWHPQHFPFLAEKTIMEAIGTPCIINTNRMDSNYFDALTNTAFGLDITFQSMEDLLRFHNSGNIEIPLMLRDLTGDNKNALAGDAIVDVEVMGVYQLQIRFLPSNFNPAPLNRYLTQHGLGYQGYEVQTLHTQKDRINVIIGYDDQEKRRDACRLLNNRLPFTRSKLQVSLYRGPPPRGGCFICHKMHNTRVCHLKNQLCSVCHRYKHTEEDPCDFKDRKLAPTTGPRPRERGKRRAQAILAATPKRHQASPEDSPRYQTPSRVQVPPSPLHHSMNTQQGTSSSTARSLNMPPPSR